ncbi:MAG: hypothetical protein ACOCYO_08980 [Bacteroidota bacterium]
MKIINPLYDLAFKYLMQEERFAKKVLGVILDADVRTVELRQQESVFEDESRMLRVFRLDFKATICDSNGKESTVLIELQKSKFSTDIERFRNYLGMNYMSRPDKKGESENVAGEPLSRYQTESKGIYPIITIYILGYSLPDLPYLAVSVNRDVVNAVTKEKIETRSFFVEYLTHQAHIIQVNRLPEERRTKLEKFLTFFNQAWISDSDYILDLKDVPDEFSDIAQHLNAPLNDDQFRRNLELERQIEYEFYQKDQKLQMLKESLEKQREENMQKAFDLEKERLEKKNIANRLKETAKMLKDLNIPVEDIARKTGLRAEEIEKL